MMDVNYLLHRQQVALIRASAADCAESRASHEGMERAYRARIAAYRQYNQAHFGERANPA